MSFDLQGPGLWYVTRATGLVALLLLTASVLLGLLNAGRFRGERWPRFLTQGLHANLSLLVLAFLTLHVASTVLDSYTSISLTAAFVPFASSYKPLWLSLGAVAVDLLIALAVTSLLRGQAWPPGLAACPLAGVRLLAGGGGARSRHRHGPGGDLGHRADRGLRRGRRGDGRLAGRRRHSGRGTVTGRTIPLARHQAPRLLAGLSYSRRPDLAEHERWHGPLPSVSARLIDVVDASGLTGRGGAGFPTGRKMRAVATRRGRKVVVANGAEGEPASSKDRLLLTRLPHLVLDGITLAAAAVGADQAYLCLHEHETHLLASLDAAVAERRDQVRIEVTGIPGRYVASEQTAIVRYLNGGPGKPAYSPPRPQEKGVRGLPTLVNNVETFAHLALIARHGDRWFRSAGLPAAPGTMLTTVSGAVCRPGVYEVELGTPLGAVLSLAGGPAEPVSALLAGGYFGAWLPAQVALPLPMTHAALKAAGGALGAGIIVALPESSCLIAETARVVRYLAGEGAGQCGPCVFGLPALADALSDLAFHGGRGRALGRLAALLPLVERRGACRHPDGVTQLIRSALRTAAADARWHDEAGPCHGIRRAPMLPVPDDEAPQEDA